MLQQDGKTALTWAKEKVHTECAALLEAAMNKRTIVSHRTRHLTIQHTPHMTSTTMYKVDHSEP